VTAVRHGFDLAVDLLSSLMWALAAFFISARLLSTTAGSMIALAVFVTALTFVVLSRMQETRARSLALGACPRCREALRVEHQHRRWEASLQQWLPPLTTWDCPACGFEQDESLTCERCPSLAT
jgi:uncharacterized protein YbaR (Trm112 family)